MVHEYQSTQDWLNTHPFRKHHLPAIPSQHIVDDRRYGRHGDIKAENILHFVDDTVDNDLGSLVIADFGLTDFHKRATRSEVPAGHVTGSPSYEPPELMLHSKISRAYDIWSLACVYLEFITWLVCGWDDLERFPQARSLIGVQNTVDDDTFFTVLEGKPPTAEIRESVRDWIADLHEQPRCSAFIHDLLSLISEQMLVVDPADRIRCGPLNWTLKGMITKAERHPEYLTKPSPTSPRNQRPHPLSLAGFKANDKNRPPGPLEDFSPPKRQSTSLGLHSMRPLATCA
jgi:serine/threonine protein kinase